MDTPLPLLSIIVPVYKVETLLPKCIESILSQPFKDYELLLIDDGSPDRCGEICREYAARDNRIKVFTKPNGGLSSARNYGLERATGKYISFLDSDDYLSGDYYSKAIAELESDPDLDIVCLQYAMAYPDGRIELRTVAEAVADKNESAESYLNFFISNPAFAWLKVYRRERIRDIRYPEGRILEDVYVLPDLFENTSKAKIIQQDGYYAYLQRQGSICHTVHTPAMIRDIATADGRKIALCRKYSQGVYMQMLATFCSSYLNALVLFPDENYDDLAEMYEGFTFGLSDIMKAEIKASQKMKLLMLKTLGYKKMSGIYRYIYKLKH